MPERKALKFIPFCLVAALVLLIGCNGNDESVIIGECSAWSPDGSTIAYRSLPYSTNDTAGIWLIDTDGTNNHYLCSGISADWSPDGQRLVIATPDWNICLIDKDGSNFEYLVHDWSSNSPTWSSDGKWIAFVRPFAFDGLDIINLETLEETVIPDASRGDWSPDGQNLCFAYRFNGVLGIGYADISIREVKQIALLDEDKYGPITPPPRWSPDGDKILFQMGSDIWVIDTGGEDLKRLTKDAMDPDWSPDGERIVYTNLGKGEELWIMNANGRNEHPLGEE